MGQQRKCFLTVNIKYGKWVGTNIKYGKWVGTNIQYG